jgi:hypothetical protein
MSYRTLSAFDVRPTWPASWGTTDVKLVLVLDRDVVSSDGIQYEGGKLGASALSSVGFYFSSDITVTDGVGTAAAIANLPTTDTVTPAHSALYYAYIYVRGVLKARLADGRAFHLHESVNGSSTSFTWYQWVNAQQWRQGSRDLPMIADRVTVQAMIDAAARGHANDVYEGVTYLDVAPDSASRPEAVGRNSPLVTRPLGIFNVKSYGAVGDGATNDTAAITAAKDACEAAGGGAIFFPPGTYLLSSVPSGVVAYGSVSWVGSGKSTVLKKLAATGYGPMIQTSSERSAYGTYTAGTGAITAGTVSLTLNTVAGLAIGDSVELQLGDDPSDCCHSGNQYLSITTISNIVGNVVTFANPIAEAVDDISGITDPATGQQKVHNVRKLTKLAANIEIAHLSFDNTGATLATENVTVNGAVNVWVHDIYSPSVYGTLAAVSYSQNVVVERIYAAKAPNSNVALGWGVRNATYRNLECDLCDSIALDFELQNRSLTVEKVDLRGGATIGSFTQFINFGGGTKGAVLRGSTFYSAYASGRLVFSGNVDHTENITVIGNTKLSLDTAKHRGFIRWNSYLLTVRKRFTKTYTLPAGANGLSATVISGIPVNAQFYASSITGGTQFYFTRNGTASANLLSSLIAGETVDFSGVGGFASVADNGSGVPLNNIGFYFETGASYPGGTVTVSFDYYLIPGVDDRTQGKVQA